jgi:hypothetical protein
MARLAATEAVEEARNLRVGGEGRAGAGEDVATLGFRGMVRAAADRRRSLGQGGAARCKEAHRPQVGWMAVRPTVGRSEVKNKASTEP